MGEAPPVRVITREEVRHAFRQSTKPGREAVIGATIALISKALQAISDPQVFKGRSTVAAVVIGGIVGWAVRLVINVWKAPREIAAEDRKVLENAHAKVIRDNEELRRKLAQRDVSDRETFEKLIGLTQTANSLLIARERDRGSAKAQADWVQHYNAFKGRLVDLMAHHLSHGDRFDLQSAFRDVSSDGSPWDQMEETVRRTSQKLGALVQKYETRARDA